MPVGGDFRFGEAEAALMVGEAVVEVFGQVYGGRSVFVAVGVGDELVGVRVAEAGRGLAAEYAFGAVVYGGEADGPGLFAGGSETAAVEQATQASESQAEHEGGGEDVEVFQYGEFFSFEVDDHDQDGADDAAEELQAAAPDGEDFEEIALIFTGMVQHEHDAGADDAGEQDVNGEIGDVIGIFALETTAASSEEHGGDEAEYYYEAVTFDGDVY